jgi:hypothetical protein
VDAPVLEVIAEQRERPPDLGQLELTVTPSGKLDRDAVERYAEVGISRLVLLPQPDAERADRHRPVPLSQILANLDSVAEHLISSPATRLSGETFGMPAQEEGVCGPSGRPLCASSLGPDRKGAATD